MGYGILNEDLTEPYIKDILKLIIATNFNLANDLLVLKFVLIILECIKFFFAQLCGVTHFLKLILECYLHQKSFSQS